MCHVYGVVLHYLILHVGLLSGNKLDNSNSTEGLAEEETVIKNATVRELKNGGNVYSLPHFTRKVVYYSSCATPQLAFQTSRNKYHLR